MNIFPAELELLLVHLWVACPREKMYHLLFLDLNRGSLKATCTPLKCISRCPIDPTEGQFNLQFDNFQAELKLNECRYHKLALTLLLFLNRDINGKT